MVTDGPRRLLEDGVRKRRRGLKLSALKVLRRISKDHPAFPEAACHIADIRREQGRLREARAAIGEALARGPMLAIAWRVLARVERAAGDPERALAAARRASLLAPDTAASYRRLHREAVASGLPQDRISRLWCLLRPSDPDANSERAAILLRAGATGPSRAHLRRAILSEPRRVEDLFELGQLERDAARRALAARLYDWTAVLAPSAPKVLNNRGYLAFLEGDWSRAARRFAEAARADPRFAIAWSNRGRALLKADARDDAERALRRALLLDPAEPQVCSEIAELLQRPEWAWRAVRADPLRPEPYTRLARFATGDPGRDGVRHFSRRAALVGPSESDAWYNLSVECTRSGDVGGAARYGKRATRIRDGLAEAHLNTSLALLALERFREGWSAHSRRFDMPPSQSPRPVFAIPQWTGEDLGDRHLLLWGEQGIGDEIMFMTLVPHLLRDRAKLTILTEPRLRPIVRRSFPGVRVPEVEAAEGMPDGHHGADLHLAIGDLPLRLSLFCGGRAEPEPWIRPDPQRVRSLRTGLLDRAGGRPLVGLAWRSVAPRTGARRTIEPALWRPIGAVGDLGFVSLQYGLLEEDWSAFRTEAGIELDAEHDIDPVADLDGFAALVAAVDLVVSPANNTVHFAGAMGKPCCTLLPTRPDWRWGLTRSDSLWYPRTRVYRQERDDDWAPVMGRVAEDLRSWAADGAFFNAASAAAQG